MTEAGEGGGGRFRIGRFGIGRCPVRVGEIGLGIIGWDKLLSASPDRMPVTWRFWLVADAPTPLSASKSEDLRDRNENAPRTQTLQVPRPSSCTPSPERRQSHRATTELEAHGQDRWLCCVWDNIRVVG